MARCSFPVDGVGVDENGTPMAQRKGASRISKCFWKTWESNYPLVNIQKAIEHGPVEIGGFTH